jgi:hypothetical protein
MVGDHEWRGGDSQPGRVTCASFGTNTGLGGGRRGSPGVVRSTRMTLAGTLGWSLGALRMAPLPSPSADSSGLSLPGTRAQVRTGWQLG